MDSKTMEFFRPTAAETKERSQPASFPGGKPRSQGGDKPAQANRYHVKTYLDAILARKKAQMALKIEDRENLKAQGHGGPGQPKRPLRLEPGQGLERLVFKVFGEGD